MKVSRDVPYTSHHDPLRQFDLYHGEHDSSGKLICFIHGGAWRSEDKSDHAALAESLVRSTGMPVAVPNYRLTTIKTSDIIHPIHTEDVLDFLHFILSWEGLGPNPPTSLHLMGHSCGAHILTSILLNSSAITPTIAPSPQLLNTTNTIILSEGIYDIDLLLVSFPEYRDWFIRSTFGEHPSYKSFSTTTYTKRNELNDDARWVIVQSDGDTLIDFAQSKGIYQHLALLGYSNVHHHFDEFHCGHNDILVDEKFHELVTNIVLK